ncbi:MAG: type II toxin-antitoxin system Phd/YefM family antitoxin, partial [Candidatus Limnocylindrales bacterium]
RDLRHRLREYLERVEAGEGFEVTVFGRPVAHLRPVSTGPMTLPQLVAEGRVTPPSNPDTSNLPVALPATTGITASAALLAERQGDQR